MPAYDLPRIMAHPSAPRVEPPQSTPQYAESPATSPDDPPLTFDLAPDDEDDAAIPRPVDPSAPVRMDDVPEPLEPEWNIPPDVPTITTDHVAHGVRSIEAALRIPIRLTRYANGDAHRTSFGANALFDCTMRYTVTLCRYTDSGGVRDQWYWSLSALDGEMVDVTAPLLPHYRLEKFIREHVAIVEA